MELNYKKLIDIENKKGFDKIKCYKNGGTY